MILRRADFASFNVLVEPDSTAAHEEVCVDLCMGDSFMEAGRSTSYPLDNVTLELVNLSPFDYRLKSGMPIAQLFLYKLTTPLTKGYDGLYQKASGPTSMRTGKKPL